MRPFRHLPCLFALLPAVAQTTTSPRWSHPVPIHGQVADPVGGRYGLWTAAPDWKASFDHGFTFYPWIPGAPVTRGLQWRTASVRRGADELLGGPAVERHTDARYEVVRGGIVEAYDVRDDGIEQTFCLQSRPAGQGELVIEGAITTPFTAPASPKHHGALLFTADGEPAVRYGAAFAIDATGHRTPIATSFDGERIRLHVDAALVDSAVFPLLIDPLSSNAAVRTSTQPILATSACAASAQGITRVFFAVVRQFSATDNDAYGFISTDNPTPGFLDVFTDVTTSWSTDSVDLAEVGGASSWALAIDREFSATSFGARVYVAGYVGALNTGTTLFAPATTATTKSAIGGMVTTGTQALLLSGNAGSCEARVVDCVALTLGAVHTVATQATDWAVNSLTFPGYPWCTVVRAGASPELRLRMIDQAGGLDAAHVVPNTSNATGPAIDGAGARFLLTWGSTVGSPITLNRLNAQRFDLTAGQSPTYGAVRTLASASLLNTFSRRDMAYDWLTASHWVVGYHSYSALSGSYQGRLLRLGFTGGTTESVDCNAAAGADTILPCAAHSGVLTTGSHFAAGYAVPGATTSSFVHRRFDYQPAGTVFYGSSCSNVTQGDGHPPYAGSEYYRLAIYTGLPGTLCLHAIGTAPQTLPLDFLGMIGCNLLVDPITTTAAIADGASLAQATYALPDSPLFLGDLYGQWFWYDPPANAFGWRSSAGAQIMVR